MRDKALTLLLVSAIGFTVGLGTAATKDYILSVIYALLRVQ